MSDKSPLLPSLLYTEGSEKVNREVEEELQVPDPAPKAAGRTIAAHIVEKAHASETDGR